MSKDVKKKVRVEVFDDNCNYQLPTNPKEFIKFFQDKFDLVPEEHRDTTLIDVEADTYYESPVLNVKIFYLREETDEEEQQRLSGYKRDKERQRIAELKLYNELKAKYEGDEDKE